MVFKIGNKVNQVDKFHGHYHKEILAAHENISGRKNYCGLDEKQNRR
jgi:hypothetical protein